MPEEVTTETLYRDLSPEARREAVWLATRLQEERGEAAHVVEAAREMGVEDRFLREAAVRLARRPAGDRRPSPSPVAASVAAAFFLGQVYAGAVAFGDVTANDLWIPVLLAGALGATLPRGRNAVLATLAVASTWLAITLFYGVASHLTGWRFPALAFLRAFRIATVELVCALGTAFVANAIAGVRPPARA